MDFKLNDRVEVTNRRSQFYGHCGTVVQVVEIFQENRDPHTRYRVKLDAAIFQLPFLFAPNELKHAESPAPGV